MLSVFALFHFHVQVQCISVNDKQLNTTGFMVTAFADFPSQKQSRFFRTSALFFTIKTAKFC